MLPRKRQKALVQKRWEMIRFEMYHNVSKLLIWNMGTTTDPSKTCHKFSDWFPNFQAVDSFILFDFILHHNFPQNLCMVAMDCSDCCVFCRYISIHQVFMSKTWVLNCNPFAKKYHINIKSFSAYLPTIFFSHIWFPSSIVHECSASPVHLEGPIKKCYIPHMIMAHRVKNLRLYTELCSVSLPLFPCRFSLKTCVLSLWKNSSGPQFRPMPSMRTDTSWALQ